MESMGLIMMICGAATVSRMFMRLVERLER